jgi:SAM-dependent methyltransferase
MRPAIRLLALQHEAAMKEIESNKTAWAKLSKDHYLTYSRLLSEGNYSLNSYISRELGDIRGKKIIHLQCNTGADSIVLARLGAKVVGVDLVPANIHYAKKLAADFNVNDIRFIESDIMTLSETHKEKYDIVFTSEGALGWLPDLYIWGSTIRSLLKDEGYLYVFDSHPFFLAMDAEKLSQEVYEIKYPYFGKAPDVDDTIGGYASEAKHGVKAYFWMYTISDVINSLVSAGLHIEYFHEFTENFCNTGNMKADKARDLYYYDYNTDKYPMSFSLKATVYRKQE